MTVVITQNDLVKLSTYRQGRDEYIRKMIGYKKDRRVRLADKMTLLFENRNTVLFQIQELVNSEDLTDQDEIDEYIEIYSGMLPSDNELSATLFIEMDNQQLLEELLVKLKGIEQYLSLVVGDETIQAVFEEEHNDREFTTSVHYLKFPLTETVKNELITESADSIRAKLVLNHPNLSSEALLSPETIRSLQKDLS